MKASEKPPEQRRDFRFKVPASAKPQARIEERERKRRLKAGEPVPRRRRVPAQPSIHHQGGHEPNRATVRLFEVRPVMTAQGIRPKRFCVGTRPKHDTGRDGGPIRNAIWPEGKTSNPGRMG